MEVGSRLAKRVRKGRNGLKFHSTSCFSLLRLFNSSRVPVELASAQSMIPLHSVTASSKVQSSEVQSQVQTNKLFMIFRFGSRMESSESNRPNTSAAATTIPLCFNSSQIESQTVQADDTLSKRGGNENEVQSGVQPPGTRS
ncbi:hypothetical protein Dimus_021085, partial [Dionaea muscipula]